MECTFVMEKLTSKCNVMLYCNGGRKAQCTLVMVKVMLVEKSCTFQVYICYGKIYA